MKKLFLLLFLSLFCRNIQAQNLPCFNETRDMKVDGLMPYTKVKVGNAEGYFLIDFGTTGSTIDMNGFAGTAPAPVSGTTNSFAGFDFFGLWGTVSLAPQNHSNIRLDNIRQAGILGTDFLSLNVFMFDYVNLKILRAGGNSPCDENTLVREGFRAASCAGYFSNDINKLNNTCSVNIPTIPIKIGHAAAVAQVDPGYGDTRFRHAVNINQAFFDAIKQSGVTLVENPPANHTLSTCVPGVSETVLAYKLPGQVNFSVTGVDGSPIIVHSDVNIFLKKTPPEAKKCGGIGTWTIPAAQMGASFLVDAKKVIFDPIGQKVWFYTR